MIKIPLTEILAWKKCLVHVQWQFLLPFKKAEVRIVWGKHSQKTHLKSQKHSRERILTSELHHLGHSLLVQGTRISSWPAPDFLLQKYLQQFQHVLQCLSFLWTKGNRITVLWAGELHWYYPKPIHSTGKDFSQLYYNPDYSKPGTHRIPQPQ